MTRRGVVHPQYQVIEYPMLHKATIEPKKDWCLEGL